MDQSGEVEEAFVDLHGARVSTSSDMPDDVLKWAVGTVANALSTVTDVNWETTGDAAVESGTREKGDTVRRSNTT